jgi:hypothetical protein
MLLLFSSAVLPVVLQPGVDDLPRLLVAAILVTAALGVGVTGDEWRALAGAVARRVPRLTARAA